MVTAKKAASDASAKSAGWSQHVTETSHAMVLEPDVFKGTDPDAIARSLKASAERSRRLKSDPYRSAMSMLTFYVNRAGHRLDPAQKERLEAAKVALRVLFGRDPEGQAATKVRKAPLKKAVATNTAAKRAIAKKAAAKKVATKKVATKKAAAPTK